MPNHIYIFLLKRLSILLVALFVFSEKSSAQNYQSVFGNVNTSWNIYWPIFDGAITDSLCENKVDTMLNSKVYRIINNAVVGSQSMFGLLREDTVSGKLWFIDEAYTNTGIEYLIEDLSLNLNDTFAVKLGGQDSLVLVDSVYYLNNKKHIRLNYMFYSVNEKLTFIEGVGPNAGINYQHFLSTFGTETYLLCKYNELQQIYSNVFFQGDCYVGYSGIPKLTEQKLFDVFPNPVNNNKKLSIKTAKTGNYKLSIYDICGRLQLISPFENSMNEFDMNFENGVYVVIIEDIKSKHIERCRIIIN